MKIGYNEATAMKRSNLKTDLELVEKYGYDYIEIRLDMLNDYLNCMKISDLSAFFQNSNVKPYALNAIEEMNFRDKTGLLEMTEQIKNACNIAEKIQNPYLIVVPSFRNEAVKGKSTADIEENSCEVLDKLADIAEGYGVKIAFEPVGFKDCAVRSMKQAWDIVKKVNRQSVGLVIDAFNVYLFNGLKDIDVLEEIDADKIFVFHVDDCEGNIPIDKLELKHRVWPGEGVIPLKDMIKTLIEKGYDRIASVELFNPDYWELDPEVCIKTAKVKTESVIKDAVDSLTERYIGKKIQC